MCGWVGGHTVIVGAGLLSASQTAGAGGCEQVLGGKREHLASLFHEARQPLKMISFVSVAVCRQ